MILVEVVLVFDLSQIKQEHLPLLLFCAPSGARF